MTERPSMWLGAFCYCCYIASLIKVKVYVVYIAAVIIGFGAAILWVAQGAFLIACSDETTRGRNSGLFWAIFQLSGIFGNLAAFFILGHNKTPSYLFIVLLICGCAGTLFLGLLQPLPSTNVAVKRKDFRGALALLMHSLKLLVTNKQMILISVIMFYSGLELSYFSGEFPLLMDSKLIGAVMSLFGVGEVVGGLFVGKLSDIVGRKVMLVFGTVVYSGGLLVSWFMKSETHLEFLPYIAAVMLGVGDSTFNTQIYSSLGDLFEGEEDLVAAFTGFQFVQNIGSAAGFFYAPYLPLHGVHGTVYPLIILWVVGGIGTLLFLLLDISPKKKSVLEDVSINQ